MKIDIRKIPIFVINLEDAVEQQQPPTIQNDTDNKISASDTASLADNAALIDTQAENLCLAKVFLKGADPFEFITQPDSPILKMLNNHLTSDDASQNELMYLNSAGAGNDAVYFMSASLLCVETESINRH